MPYISRAKRCSDAELSEIIEFACGVFNVDFPNLLPRLYREGADTGHDHFAVREDGKLAAAVISYPLDAYVAGHTLATNGVGTVSVGGEYRGKGYMTDLLTSCLTDAVEQGAAFSILGGQRQRYAYFGYARIGEHHTFSVTRQSLRHTVGLRESAFTFREATDADSEALVRLMQTQSVYAQRSADDFLFAAASGYRKTYVVLKDQKTVGYFIAKPDLSSVSEMVLPPDDGYCTVDELVPALLSDERERVDIDVPVHETKLFSRLFYISDDRHSASLTNVSVLDFPAVLSAYGELACRTRSIPDGRFVLGVEVHPFFEKIGIAKRGRTHGNFGISVEGGRFSAQPVDAPADVTLPYIDALELLFTRIGETVEYLPALCRTLLPLPFYFPQADKV